MNRLSLQFISNGTSAELCESEFSSPILGRSLRCIRGRQAFTDSIEGTFQWTSAVQSLSAVVIKAKIAGLSLASTNAWPQSAGLSSDLTSWALTLDFALSKKPRWLLDMFGVDRAGSPLVKRLFTRMNPERKRPGPCWVAVSPAFLAPKNISIFLDGGELRTELELANLLKLIGLVTPSSPERAVAPRVLQLAPKITSRQTSLSTAPTRAVLAPFLDHYILELAGLGLSERRDQLISKECRLAFRLALLAFDTIFIPAVSYVQSPLCKKIIDEHYSFAELGVVRLVTDAPTWTEFFELRNGEYKRKSPERALYSSLSIRTATEGLPFKATGIDTTKALHDEWHTYSAHPQLHQRLLNITPIPHQKLYDVTSALQNAAEDMGRIAFVAKNITTGIKRQGLMVKEREITKAICDLFFSHYRSKFDLDLFDDLAFGCPVDLSGTYHRFSFTALSQRIRSSAPSLWRQLDKTSAEKLWSMRDSVSELLWSTPLNNSEQVCMTHLTTA